MDESVANGRSLINSSKHTTWVRRSHTAASNSIRGHSILPVWHPCPLPPCQCSQLSHLQKCSIHPSCMYPIDSFLLFPTHLEVLEQGSGLLTSLERRNHISIRGDKLFELHLFKLAGSLRCSAVLFTWALITQNTVIAYLDPNQSFHLISPAGRLEELDTYLEQDICPWLRLWRWWKHLCGHGCVGVSNASRSGEENSTLMSSLLLKAGSINGKEINGSHSSGTDARWCMLV